MAESPVKSPGQMLATMLAGSWRRSLASIDCRAEELEEIAPLVLRSGAAALCWRRVKSSDLRNTSAVKKLQQAYRNNVLQAALQQQSIVRVFKLLRSAGIEPILVKGWAAARLYPDEGSRHCGDIDLCVSPEQYRKAVHELKKLEDIYVNIDLHCGFEKFGGGSFAGCYERSELVRLEEIDVRVPSAEDHLRILSIHMLREGAWRPLWLCDVAVAVEARPSDFDWKVCLTENRRRADWVSCAIKLAQKLLGANAGDIPLRRGNRHLPRWLVSTVLKEWESSSPSMPQRHIAPMSCLLHNRRGILNGLRARWPNPIEATVSMGGTFNGLPRLPLQFGSYFARSAKFAAQVPKLLRER